MDKPLNTEEVSPGNIVRETGKTIKRRYFAGDVFDSPIHADSGYYNTMPNVCPESSLQRYWIEDGFLDESKGVKLEDTHLGQANDRGVTKEVNSSSLFQRRGRGRPRKVNSTAAMQSKDNGAVKLGSGGGCIKRITRSTSKGLSLEGVMASKRQAVTLQNQGRTRPRQSIDEYFDGWSKQIETVNAKKKQKTGLISSKTAPVPKKRGRPPSRAGLPTRAIQLGSRRKQLYGKNSQTTQSLKPILPEGTVNTPRKRGRPQKHPLVELPVTELCTPCYLKVCVKFGKTLYNKVLRLEAVGSVLTTEVKVGKQARPKQRKVKEKHPAQLIPKEELVCMGAGPSNWEETTCNGVANNLV